MNIVDAIIANAILGGSTSDVDATGLVPNTRTVNGHQLTADVVVSKTDVGLSAVTNVAQMPLTYLDTDGTLAANSNTKVPSQAAVVSYTSSLIAANDALVFKGVIDAFANPNYPAATVGHTYKISVAGKIGGASGTVVGVGDLILCTGTDVVSGDQATVGIYWSIIPSNSEGAVIGPAAATDGNIPLYDGISGVLLKNSTYSPASFEPALGFTPVADSVTVAGHALTGNVAVSLDDISDAIILAPAKNQTLIFNGTNWVNAAAGTSFTFAIASFTTTAGAATQEIGLGVWKAIGALSFAATYNNGPATDGHVTKTSWTDLTLTGTGFVGPTVSLQTASYPVSPGSSVAFILHATDGVTSPTNTNTITFNNRRFFGIATKASSYTSSDVVGLAASDLVNSVGKTFTVSPSTLDYIIYAYPTRLGTATFTVGGFVGGFLSPETVAVTNASGYIENFYVYRSTNVNLGTTVVVAS